MTDRDQRADRYRALFEAHRSALLGYLARRTAGPDDAADAFGEVLLVLWRRLDDAPPGDEARPWLFGVARRVLANERRGRRRRSRLVERLAAALPADAFIVPASEPSDITSVRAELDRLPADDAELVRLVACEGLTPAEAGRAVGLSCGLARVRLHRARARLRAALEDQPVQRSVDGGDVDTAGARPLGRQEVR
jgi:RNA polymerase sigma factor (sigma-70 family)